LLFDPLYNKAPAQNPDDLEKIILGIDNEVGIGSSSDDKLLHDTYRDILERNTGNGAIAQSHARRAFRLLLATCESLSFSAIAEAVSIEHDFASDSGGSVDVKEYVNEKYIRKISHNFLVEGLDGAVEFVHMSALDFLRNGQQGEPQDGYAPLDSATEMAHTCLHFIRSFPFCKDKTAKAITDNVSGVVVKLDWGKYFQNYAYRYWPRHCAVMIRLSGENSEAASRRVADVLTDAKWTKAIDRWVGTVAVYDFEPQELSLYTHGDPRIFLAAMYGLPQLTAELIGRLGPSTVNKKSHLGRSPLELAIDPSYFFRYSECKKSWAMRCFQEPGAKFGEDVAYLETAKILIERGADVSSPNTVTTEPVMHLMICGTTKSIGKEAQCRRVELLNCLRDHGANINAVTDTGSTLLHEAAWYGDEQIMGWLLSNRAEVAIRDSFERTAMHLAAEGCSLSTLQKLRNQNESLLEMRDHDGRTPLAYAAIEGDPERIKFFIELGADLKAGRNGGNIWHCVVRNRSSPALIAILEEGETKSLADARDNDGRTPLMTAALFGYAWWIGYLYKLGAKLDAVASGNSSVVHFAAARHYNLIPKVFHDWLLARATLFGWLGARGANLDAADDNGVTGLMISAARGDTAGVICLLQNGAKATLKDHHGRTALHYALMRGLKKVSPIMQGRTIRNIKDIITLLFKKGVEVNQEDLNGTTALMIAGCSGWDHSLRLLLQKHGADASIRSSEGLRLVVRPNGTVGPLVNAQGDPAKHDLVSRYRAVLDRLLEQYVPDERFSSGVYDHRYNPESIKRYHEQVRMRIAANDDSIYDLDTYED
jgi:ankyrin repeat protein